MSLILEEILEDAILELTRLGVRVKSLIELLLTYPNGFDFTLRTGNASSIYMLENNSRIIIGIIDSGNLIMISYGFNLCDTMFSELLARQ